MAGKIESQQRIISHKDQTPLPERQGSETHHLEPDPPGVSYDSELERLCRIAASVGGDQSTPISYTALVIALLFSEDPVSQWFQSYVTEKDKGIDLDEIFRSKNTSSKERDSHLSRAASGSLPRVSPLYSRSVRNLMEQAARVARDVAKEQLVNPTLSPRHLMAAYVFRNPSDHRDQVRGWGFRESDWQERFLQFAEKTYPGEQWSRLKGFVRPYVDTISSFTADDPLAPPRDLLGVEEEAAAFARIAAATSIKPPLAIGIFGEWGSGKTFFMRRIYENVKTLTGRDASHPGGPLFHNDIVQIRFNAWHYIETNLWASLVEYIFAELDRWLLERPGNARPKVDLVFNSLATAQQLKLDALEDVVARRAERQSAELRAERARREYEEAVARSTAVRADTYARAFLDTLLARDDIKKELEGIGKALGAPEIAQSAGRVSELLQEAHSEAGRSRLVMRAGVAKLGTWRWILSVGLVLVGLPLLVIGLKDSVAWLTKADAIKSIHDTVLALATLVAGIVACVGALIRRASTALKEIDGFDQKLSARVAEQTQQVQRSDVSKGKVTAEDDLRKRRQALDASERALTEADAKLTAARQDFESATARSRLNAFIRAKATEGDYAKHLGIIASIRRDFGQLATLMGAASDSDEQRAESSRLANEARVRVERFLDWLKGESEVRLTPGELRSLLSLLAPEMATEVLNSRRDVLASHLEGNSRDLDSLGAELQASVGTLPKFSRIILYIDDLDRCPPETVVNVLQAVHLLLSFPLFTVIVAVDARWVSRALRKRFPNLLAETGIFSAKGEPPATTGASSHDYLEKIFQIPYWVRPIDPDGAMKYVNSLLDADVRRVANVTDVADRALSTPSQPRSNLETTPSAPTPSGKSAQQARQEVKNVPPTSEQHEAASLELTRWEVDALERFAPLVCATPRRLIRFVNVYRLIKTSLPPRLLEDFIGDKGESDNYRALVAQLAIVTAAPDASLQYFSALEELGKQEPLAKISEKLADDAIFQGNADHEIVERILDTARGWYSKELTIEHMLMTARLARRYSFTARAR